MQSLMPLKSFFGYEKTLVITCHECLSKEENNGQVFYYHSLGNMLRKADNLQQECVRYYLEAKGCSQIILAGHYDCHVINKILENKEVQTSSKALQYNVDGLLLENVNNFSQPHIKNKMLIELNVLEQVRLLMSYDFISEKVNCGLLKVIGVVFNDGANSAREIFRNGIAFNNLIISN
ncbi:MAG TPA: carbonic anhydrase [Cyclobacteriaceae bacterium]|nr:carbonic anhydrase [Cyclobacteriaceae bacterium]